MSAHGLSGEAQWPCVSEAESRLPGFQGVWGWGGEGRELNILKNIFS